jgi:hypothetical protein
MNRHKVTADRKCQQMVVFSQKELDWMDIDGIYIGPARCLLVVVMFVNVAINGLDMKYTVHDCVKEVIDNVKWNKRQQQVGLDAQNKGQVSMLE